MIIKKNDVHIVNGDVAAGNWKSAFQDTSGLLIQRDIISFGPTPYYEEISQWQAIRTSFLQNMVLDDYVVDFNDYKYDLLKNYEKLKKAENIYLWVSIGLSDQIIIPFVAYVLKLTGARFDNIKLIQFVKSKKYKSNYRGLGEVNPENILKHPEPISLSTKDLQYCYEGWCAYTSNTPNKLSNYLSIQNTNLKYLSPALKFILRHYPHKKSRLSYWDELLLTMIQKHSPLATRAIGFTLGHKDNNIDIVGDAYLFYRMHELAKMPYPLVRLSGNTNNMRTTNAALTELGKEVVNHKSSMCPKNPIDEWVGGVHLSSENNKLWFYENGKVEKSVFK